MPLIITHNAGFFSNCSEALVSILRYFNGMRGLDGIDRSSQYSFYKVGSENLIPMYFEEKETNLPYESPIRLTGCEGNYQFTDYSQLNFNDVKPFVDKFFTPSKYVLSLVEAYEKKYNIDYENTCAILYRGNDKVTECPIAPYDDFIDNAPVADRYFVLPDEQEFMRAFSLVHHNSFTPDELPCINKDETTANFYQVPIEQRAEYAAKFFAAVLVASKCKHLVTHTGNVSLWAVLYRGNMNNVRQWLNSGFIW